MWTKHPH